MSTTRANETVIDRYLSSVVVATIPIVGNRPLVSLGEVTEKPRRYESLHVEPEEGERPPGFVTLHLPTSVTSVIIVPTVPISLSQKTTDSYLIQVMTPAGVMAKLNWATVAGFMLLNNERIIADTTASRPQQIVAPPLSLRLGEHEFYWPPMTLTTNIFVTFSHVAHGGIRNVFLAVQPQLLGEDPSIVTRRIPLWLWLYMLKLDCKAQQALFWRNYLSTVLLAFEDKDIAAFESILKPNDAKEFSKLIQAYKAEMKRGGANLQSISFALGRIVAPYLKLSYELVPPLYGHGTFKAMRAREIAQMHFAICSALNNQPLSPEDVHKLGIFFHTDIVDVNIVPSGEDEVENEESELKKVGGIPVISRINLRGMKYLLAYLYNLYPNLGLDDPDELATHFVPY